MTDEIRVLWSNAGPDFAEVAEALGINTVDIMAVLTDRIVLYTPKPDEPNPEIWSAVLGRDADGILVAGGKQFIERESDMSARLHAHMVEKFGPPPGRS
jgi:hypothetical protein